MKNLILIILSVLFTFPLLSQTTFDIHAGPSASWVGIDGISESFLPERTMQWTGQAGVGVETQLANSLSFVTGLDFARRGFQTHFDEDVRLFNIQIPVGVKAITTMDYLSVPAKLRFQTSNSPVGFYVEAGPRVSYAMDGRVKTKARFIVQFNTGTYGLDPGGNLLHEFEIGGELGTGIEWKMPNGAMNFGIQYYHSFSNALNDPILAVDFRNRSLGANLGYVFEF